MGFLEDLTGGISAVSTAVNPVAGVVGSIGKALGGLFGGDKEAEEKRRAREAYERVIAQLQAQQQAAEQGFMTETGSPLSAITDVQKDLQTGNTAAQQELSGQLGAEQAKLGIRGPQALRQNARAMGNLSSDLQSQINKMALSDQDKQRALRSAYLGNKSASLTQQLGPASQKLASMY